jgi:uncharacterized protein (DUF924 family)
MLSDFRLFEPLNKNLAGKRFATDADVKQVVTFWSQTLSTDFFYSSTSLDATVGQMLKRQW